MSRRFVSGRGWITDSGEESVIELMQEERDLSIVSFLPTKPNDYCQYNLKNRDGVLLLPDNVRKITWNNDGYYIIYDDRGFDGKYWIVDKNGSFLSRLTFQYVRPFPYSTVRVRYNGRCNILKMNGELLFGKPVDCIFGFYDKWLYYVDCGVLYRCTIEGNTEKCKDLPLFNCTGKFYCGNGYMIVDGVARSGRHMSSLKYFANGYHGVTRGYVDSWDLSIDIVMTTNLLIKGRHLLWENWYEDLKNSGYGLFECKIGDTVCLINAAEDIIADNIRLITYDETGFITKKNGVFVVQDYEGNVMNREFTSCVWIWNVDPTWHVYVADEVDSKCYYYGESPEIMSYAQFLLVKYKLLAILECDSVWYLLDKKWNLHECFRNYRHQF